MKDLFVFVIIVLGIIAVCELGVNSFEKGQIAKACERFSLESNRETKFVEYTFWARDCLTPTKDGKWISAFNLRSTD